MRVVLSWLNEFADFGNDVDRISTQLTSIGLAVDGVERFGGRIDGVIVARVVRLERHPDASKVTRVWVDAGDGALRHVWCGASNMREGDLVPLATLGTKMPDGREISRRGILGIDSEGMLCSGVELGVDEESSGLKILDSHLTLGANVFDAMGISGETVFDLDVTRNRPDCFGVFGVARDLAASMGLSLRQPSTKRKEAKIVNPLRVEIRGGAPCTSFAVIVLDGVRVTDSPEWMARRLRAAGMRPINNVVDVSNYVNLELNQPNHAYDLVKIAEGFVVRPAAIGETIVTLDGVSRELRNDEMLVCDSADHPVGIAGVMGGLDSEVTGDTMSLAVEIAHFDAGAVASCAGGLGLRTEASLRFERGVDPHGHDRAFDRFVDLLRLTCPDLSVRKGVARQTTSAILPTMRRMDLRLGEVARVLGLSLDVKGVRKLLEPIGFAVSGKGDEIEVGIPSWRPDCGTEIDIIEELARHHGYDALGKSVPKSPVFGRLSDAQRRRRRLREVVLGLGLSEAMPNPFLAPGDLLDVGVSEENALFLSNPLVAEESMLRTSLRPGLLKAVLFNQSHRVDDVRLFELGHVYPQGADELPDEYESLTLVAVGADAREAMLWWAEISASLEVGAQVDQNRVPPGMHPTRSATLARGKDVLGAIGEIDPAVLSRIGVQGRVACLELNATVLCAENPKIALAKPVSRFPSSDFDLSFVVANEIPAAAIHRALRQAAGGSLEVVKLFDTYRGADIERESRSLTFRLRLRAADHTLTDDEVATIRKKCIDVVAKAGGLVRQ